MLATLALLVSLLPEGLAGPHAVGFRVLAERDPARLLDGAARPLQIALWYPALATPAPPLRYGDYVALAATERSLLPLTPAAARAAQERFRQFLAGNGVAGATVALWLEAAMLAHVEAPPAPGRFPLVLVAQGNGQAAPDQAVLAELLASHGFVVATSPSQVRLGARMESEDDVLPNAQEQASDLAFVRARIARLPLAAASQVAWVGHSFGARSALLAALLEPSGVALVSLDGGIGAAAGKGWLAGERAPDATRLRVPLLHFYEDVDSLMAPDFDLLESLRFASRRLVRVSGLPHLRFSSYGWAVAAIPQLADAGPDTGHLCQAVALETIAFLKRAFGQPDAPAVPAAATQAFHWSPDTETRHALRGPVSRLRVDDGGPAGKPPVVFVHGNGASLTHWSAQLAHLRGTRRAIALDLRGHGESQPVREARYEVPEVAGDVAAVTDALDLRRFVLVAHSYGASVAGAFAAAHPERVAGLLLVDPAGDVRLAPSEALDRYLVLLRGPEYPKAARAALQQGMQDAASGVPQRVFEALALAAPEAFSGCFDGLRRYDPAASLRRYPGPLLAVLQSRREAESASVHRLLPDLPYRTLSGVSHFLMMDDPARFDRILDEFLSKVDASERPTESAAGQGRS